VIDRASTFANPTIVKLLQNEFIPVAIDQAYQRRQKDNEGDFYRKIAKQGPRDLNATTQGFYIATARGNLLVYNNNRDPQKLRRLMAQSINQFQSWQAAENQVAAIESGEPDKQFNPKPPTKGLVVRVRAKVMRGYARSTNHWKTVFQSSVSRDNLWITKKEHDALLSGSIPKKLQTRIARFHLVDNTRGEPDMWKPEEIRDIQFALTDGIIKGAAHMESEDGTRGYITRLRGKVETSDKRVTKFILVAHGDYWGEGRYTGGAPKGKFPLAVTFRLADGSDTADAIPPQGSRGWIDGYLR